jgi:hypothetical protein
VKLMAVAPEIGIVFIIAFIAMVIAEALAILAMPRCDNYCSESARKLVCMYYKFHGYVDSCEVG